MIVSHTCLVVSAGQELHMLSHPKGWSRLLYKIDSGLWEGNSQSCKASHGLGSQMSFLPHPIDQCKLESQPRNKPHILMGRIVIVDAVIYCPDPCSKTKTLFLHLPEALAIDGSQMSHPYSPTPDQGIVVCQRELPDSRLYIPPGPLQSTDSDISPQKKKASQGLFHIQNFWAWLRPLLRLH